MTIIRSLASDPRRLAIALVFTMHGAFVGTFYSRIAELRLAMGLSEAALGIALVGVSVGVLAGSLVVSGAIERLGTRRVLMVMLPVFAFGLVLSALAVGTATLFATLVLLGFGLTNANIAMNVEADRVEAATGRRLLNRCHGSWGIGFLLASLVGTGAVAAGMRPLIHFGLLAVPLTALDVALVWAMPASPPRTHSAVGRPPRRLTRPTVGVVLVMGFALSGIVLEGSARNWSVIFLRSDFTAIAWVSTLVLPAFIAMETAGRFFADPLIERFGPVRVAMAMSVVSALGLALAVAARSVSLALAGFALIGLGISTVQPQSMSAAARLGDRPSSENVAAFATLMTAINLVAPPLFGAVATSYNVRASFAMLLPLPLIALAFARFLEPPRPPEPADPS